MLNLLLATALAGQVALAHMTFFHPSMFAWDNWPDYPQDPMIDRAEEDWWFRGYPNSAPATGGEVFDLPAGGRVKTEITCHFYWTSWYGGYEETAYGAMDACPSADNSGPWHANLEPPAAEPPVQGVSGCALAIADVDDVSKVTRDNLAIFSVNSTCVFQRDTYFEVPAEMPPCTNGKCICAWFWLANFGQANFYMTGFECNVSGSSKNARSIGAAQAPNEDGTWPNGNSGPRQPFYAYNDNPSVKYIDNANRIGYHSGWGWKDGAQNDIFTGELAGASASASSSGSSAAASSAMPSSAKASSKSSSAKTSTAAQTSSTGKTVPTTSSHASSSTSSKFSSSSSPSVKTSSSAKTSSPAKTSSSNKTSSSAHTDSSSTATSSKPSSTSTHATSSATITQQDQKVSSSSSTESPASSAVSPNNHAQNKVSVSSSSTRSTKSPAKTTSSKVTSKAAKTTSTKAAQKVTPTTSSKATSKAAKTTSTKASSKAVKPTSSKASSSSSASSVAPTSTATLARDNQEEADTETVYRTVYRTKTKTVTVTSSPTSVRGRLGLGKRDGDDQQQPVEYKIEVEEGVDAEQGDLLARMAWGEAAHPGEALPGSWL